MSVPGATTAALAEVLKPGERVLWTGRPDPVATLRTQLFLWWVGLPGLAIALTLYFGDFAPPAVNFVALGIAAVFMLAPFLLVVQAYGTIYAVTDRRALILHDALGKRQLVSYGLDELDDDFEILARGDGDNIGHLYFASGARSDVAYADHTGRVAFRELRRPHEVAALIRKIRSDRSRQEKVA